VSGFPPCSLRSLMSGSDALGTAIPLFHQQLRRAIGEANPYCLTVFLSTLSHLDPFPIADNVEYGFLWIADLLKSGYPDQERYSMVSMVIQLLGKHVDSINSWRLDPSWVSALMSFLSLGEKFYSAGSLPYPGLLALRILLSSPGNLDFGPMVLSILTSTLIPTHPLKSRSLALGIFHRFMVGWFSPRMESVPNRDLAKLLQAVGDPFQFPDLYLQDGQPMVTADYKPMKAAVALVEFASSDLWQNHLRRPNFASCEEILSTEEGRRAALSCMFDTTAHSWSEFLCTPAKIIAAIKRLEELQCFNTAEVVILWAWAPGVVNPVDHNAWGLIERNTLNFYQTHGIGRLTSLLRHITNKTTEIMHVKFLLAHYRGQPCRVGGVRRPVPVGQAVRRLGRQHFGDLRVARACQLRRLYHLFGYDLVTWEEAVAREGANDGTDVLSGRHVTLIQFTDWACDYP